MTTPIQQTQIAGTVEPGQAEIEEAVSAYEGSIDIAKDAADAKKEKREALLLVMDAFGRESVTVNGRKWFPKTSRTVGSVKVPRGPKVASQNPGREKIEFEHRKNAAIADITSGRSKVAADAAARAGMSFEERLGDAVKDIAQKVADKTGGDVTVTEKGGRSTTFKGRKGAKRA